MGPIINGELVVWADFAETSNDPYYANDLVMHDLGTGQRVQLTEDPNGEGDKSLYGNLLAFTKAQAAHPSSPYDLMLMNLDTAEVSLVLSGDWIPIFPHLSERYLVFAAQSEDSTSMGRDIYYYDLQEESLHHVWESSDVFCGLNAHSGEWIFYQGTYQSMQPPFKAALYHIPSKQHIVLAPEEGASPGYALHRNLVAWSTTEYSGTWYQGPVDVVIYDVNQETSRRVTTLSSMLLPIAMHFPYLILRDLREYNDDRMRNDYYAAHLVRLGITDAEGNLLAGGGVIEPP
jgi:hypothetical protein